MRILITGATGMLGSDIMRAGERSGLDVVALSHAQSDVTDPDALRRAFAAERPDAVFNCAAYTDVDAAESDPDAAMAVNAAGAGNVSSAAAQVGAIVVYPSTDYVFDGEQDEPYVESDPPAPRSVYGRTKLAGEIATAAANPRHHIVRTSWLFGVEGRNFVETMLGLSRERDQVNVVGDQIGCPTFSGHLAGALLELIATAGFGTSHIAGAGSCSWAEFAAEIFRQAGAGGEVRPCTTAEFPRPAPRPRHAVLVSERADVPTLPAWRAALSDYLAQRAATR